MRRHGSRLSLRDSILSSIPLSLLGLALGCSSSAPTVFETGSPEEVRIAKGLAMQYLDATLLRENRIAQGRFVSTEVTIDELAMAHVRVQQVHSDVPVFGGEMIVHMGPDGSLSSVTDSQVRSIPDHFNVSPKLTRDSAIEAALSKYDCRDCLSATPAADLWILARAESKRPEPRLAYRVSLERLDGTDRTEMPVIFIDAETGEELFRYNNLQTGTGPSLYSGTVTISTYKPVGQTSYHMEDLTRKQGTFDYRNTMTSAYREMDADDVWNATAQRAAVDAHYGAAKTYDYYRNTHGRTGINGNGGPGYLLSVNGSTSLVTSIVHYGVQYNNAFWNGKMVYGDGDGVNFSPLVTLDICGHEMTHGVVDQTAKLIYSGESGALNESMADVFGAMVERYAKGESSNTWAIGESAFTPATAGDALRFMDDPHRAANGGVTADDDPDHYTERYTGTNDNGGVHTNSGIANKAFYLLAKGGAHHLGGSMADVGQPNGIGPDKAAGIWYKALTTYMTSSTGFAGARQATIDAAKALYTAGSPEELAVTQAWFLVGVGQAPVQSCSDKLCATSAMPLTIGCDPCATKICSVDPYCCSTAFDAQCVSETATVCGKTCDTCVSASFTGPGVGTVAPAASINFGSTSAFSVAYWANLNSATAHIMVKGDNGTNEWSIVTNPPNLVCFRRQGIPPNVACHPTTYGQWHHYAVTHATDGTAIMYEDGVAKALGNGSIGTAAASPLNIGNYAAGDAGTVGNFDHVAIWSKVLTAADVQNLALKTTMPSYLGSLVGEWKFDEGKGTTVADATGYGKTVNLNNVGWSTTCAACPPDMQDVNGDGKVCRPYTSCKTLLLGKPGTASGMHLIDPDGAGGKAPFGVYCEMSQSGGGWTLLFNSGTNFNKTSLGTGGADCYNKTDCISQAYSDLPLGLDLMFDADDVPILGGSQGARTVITAVNGQIISKTLYYLLNNGGDWSVERPDNTTVTNFFQNGLSCATWDDYGDAACTANSQIMLNDITVGCAAPPFEIGNSKIMNCAGWPDNTGGAVINHWPENYRLWSR